MRRDYYWELLGPLQVALRQVGPAVSQLLWALFLLLFVGGFQSTWVPFASVRAEPNKAAEPGAEPFYKAAEPGEDRGTIPSLANQPLLLSVSKGDGPMAHNERRPLRAQADQAENQATGSCKPRSSTKNTRTNRMPAMPSPGLLRVSEPRY